MRKDVVHGGYDMQREHRQVPHGERQVAPSGGTDGLFGSVVPQHFKQGSPGHVLQYHDRGT